MKDGERKEKDRKYPVRKMGGTELGEAKGMLQPL